MSASPRPRRRARGSIEELPTGGYRVKVYAGIDPVSKRRLYLDETIAPGPRAAKEAEKTRTRFLAEVDQRRSPRTRATVGQMLDRYVTVLRATSKRAPRSASRTLYSRRPYC